MTAAQNTVIRLRSLVKIHTAGIAEAKARGSKISEEVSKELADGYSSALAILIEEMNAAKEEVPA